MSPQSVLISQDQYKDRFYSNGLISKFVNYFGIYFYTYKLFVLKDNLKILYVIIIHQSRIKKFNFIFQEYLYIVEKFSYFFEVNFFSQIL